MTSLSVGVIICAYTLERWADLTASVRSALEQTPAPDEVWLVVDHHDELYQRAKLEFASADVVQVVRNARKQGLSGARNTGVELACTDVVAFLDDDAQAQPDWLARLLNPYADDAVIAVGGAAYPLFSAGTRRPNTLPADRTGVRGELDWIVGCTYAGQPVTAETVRNLMGCNMSFRRSVFAGAGGFAENLGRVGKTPLGCEETELCIRATDRYPGTRIVFEPRAIVRHHVSDDRLTWRYLRRRGYAEGVSKAAVATMVAKGQALSTERTYTTQVLPRGVLRELGSAAQGNTNSRVEALAAAGAILVALGSTVFGYARATLARSAPKPAPAPTLRMTRVD